MLWGKVMLYMLCLTETCKRHVEPQTTRNVVTLETKIFCAIIFTLFFDYFPMPLAIINCIDISFEIMNKKILPCDQLQVDESLYFSVLLLCPVRRASSRIYTHETFGYGHQNFSGLFYIRTAFTRNQTRESLGGKGWVTAKQLFPKRLRVGKSA